MNLNRPEKTETYISDLRDFESRDPEIFEVFEKARKDRNMCDCLHDFECRDPEIFEVFVRIEKEETLQAARSIYRGQDRDPRTDDRTSILVLAFLKSPEKTET